MRSDKKVLGVLEAAAKATQAGETADWTFTGTEPQVQVVRAVRDGVLERTGVRLEPEVIVPGNDWEELLNQATGDKGTRS